MAVSTSRFSRRYQASFTSFRRIHHNLCRPIACPGTMAGFTLHPRKATRSRCVAPNAVELAVCHREPLGSSPMRSAGPRFKSGTMAQLAFFGTDISGFGVNPSREDGNEQKPGRYKIRKAAHSSRGQGLNTNFWHRSRCWVKSRSSHRIPVVTRQQR